MLQWLDQSIIDEIFRMEVDLLKSVFTGWS